MTTSEALKSLKRWYSNFTTKVTRVYNLQGGYAAFAIFEDHSYGWMVKVRYKRQWIPREDPWA